MLVNSSPLFINESIFVAGVLINSFLQLLVSSLRRNLRRGFIITYLKIEGLEIEIMFNKNVIKLEDDMEYIKEATDTVVIFYLKAFLN
jgi:hypothetical protein